LGGRTFESGIKIERGKRGARTCGRADPGGQHDWAAANSINTLVPEFDRLLPPLTRQNVCDAAALLDELDERSVDCNNIYQIVPRDSAAGSHSPTIAKRADDARPAITEFDLAQGFTDQYGSKLRYVKGLGGWLVWDGRQWKRDDTGYVRHLIREFLRTQAQLNKKLPHK
jgi:hypothetical protein